jgi:hypothetical protein
VQQDQLFASHQAAVDYQYEWLFAQLVVLTLVSVNLAKYL